MKKLVSLLLAVGLACASSAQTVNPSVQKTSGTNVVSNGPVVIGSGNTLTIASGGTLTLASGSTFNAPSGGLLWSNLGSIPTPTITFSGDASGSTTLLASGGASTTLTLAASGVTAGTYGSASVSPSFTVDAKGRVTAVTNNTITASGIGALQIASNLSDVASVPTARSNLGLAIGSNVEAWSANLDSWSAKTPYVGTFTVPSGKTFAVSNSLTLAGTDGSTLNVGAGGTLGSNAYTSTAFVPQTTTVNGHALSSNVTVTPADLSLVIGTNVEAWSANLDTFATNGPSFYVPATRTVAGHALSSNVTLASSDVGLGNVTNNAQTQASIVPNTAPSSGQMLVGNSSGTAYAPVSLTGDSTLSSGGVMVNTKVNGVAYPAAPSTGTVPIVTGSNTVTYETVPNASLANSSITIAGTSTALGGSIAQDTITGLSSTGIVKRTAANTLAIASPGTDYSTPSATETLTNKTISGGSNTISNIGNSSLTNSAVTVAGNSVSLGGSVTQDQITGLSATGIVKRTAANTLAPAVAGTDYQAPISTSGAGLNLASNVLSNTGVTSLAQGAGIALSGTTGAITISATSSTNYPTGFANMAAMRAAGSTVVGTWSANTVVTLAGYNNPGDGGGGDFAWQPSDTSTDNSGTVIQVTGVTTGRLHRIIPSSNYQSQLPNTTLDIRWFGAIPDNSTDCTPGILAAENSAIFSGSNETPALYAPAGQYAIKTKLNLASGSAGSFTLFGDGANATIFVCDFSATASAMWDLGNFATLTSIRDCGFTFTSASYVLPQYLYVHQGAQLDIENVRASNFSGTFLNIYDFNTWGVVRNITTANNTGTQILVNGLGGVISEFNLGTGLGPPALLVQNCNALDIHDGQVSGGGPYVSYTGCALTSTGTTFTITQANHGFTAGDYIYISSATNSGYVNRWKIASVTSSTITVSSTAALGSDTVAFGSLWSEVYFGGAGSTALCTESSMHHVIANTGSEATVSGSCGFFFDGYSGGGVAQIKCNGLLADYGNTGVFCHGIASSAFDGTNSFIQGVITSTSYNFTLATGTSSVNVGSFVTGNWYCIETVGTGNNWTSIGASSAAVGVVFQATGAGTGGSGGTAALLTAHSLKPGGYLRITGGAYAGFWPIASVSTYTITCNSTLNAGPLITVPAEGDVISSTVDGLTLDRCTVYTGDTFGGIRIEGSNDIDLNAPQIYTPGGGSHFTTGPFTSLVISDGGQTIPQFDIKINGGSLTTIGQSAYYPATTKYGIDIDGTNVTGVQAKGILMTGSVTPFEFTNSATPFTSNLDTDFFKGTACVLQQTTGQSFTSGTAATVTWQYNSYDPIGMWSSSNPTRITPPVGAQVVHLNASVSWTSGATPSAAQIFHYNSSGTLLRQAAGGYLANASPSAEFTINSGAETVQPGDYFQLVASQSSGSSQTLQNGSPTGGVAFNLTIDK